MSGATRRLAQVGLHLSTNYARASSSAAPSSSAGAVAPEAAPATNADAPSKPSKVVLHSDASFYKYFLPFQTKWHENDMYHHMNNAVYVTYFDAIINEYLIRNCGMRPSDPENPIGLIVASSFKYAAALEFPNPVMAALAVTKVGKSSVTYAIALFSAETVSRSADVESDTFENSLRLTSTKAAAFGEMTHVFVDPATRRPVDMGEKQRSGLAKLQVSQS